jgi:hypothetical protein
VVGYFGFTRSEDHELAALLKDAHERAQVACRVAEKL